MDISSSKPELDDNSIGGLTSSAGGTAELISKAETYLIQCGSCDAGLSMSCVCPPGDPRAIISELVAALNGAPQPVEIS